MSGQFKLINFSTISWIFPKNGPGVYAGLNKTLGLLVLYLKDLQVFIAPCRRWVSRLAYPLIVMTTRVNPTTIQLMQSEK